MFELVWTEQAQSDFERLREAAQAEQEKPRNKSGKAQGLFKQVRKALSLLEDNPRHPGLRTHEYHSLLHPYEPSQKVFEAYAQNNTPGAHRIFWCYGPRKQQITVLAITPHP